MDGYLAGIGLETAPVNFPPLAYGLPAHRADGADEMRRVVRHLLRAGADWIKVMATGGVEPATDYGPGRAEFTFEELEVAVQEAARKGKFVMAHAFGGEGLDNAVRAGARSIEHGVEITEAQAQAMKDRGCWLVPTMTSLKFIAAAADAGEVPEGVAERARAIRNKLGQSVPVVREYGIKIAVGTDCYDVRLHGTNLSEIASLHEAGFPIEQVLLAATIGGAELCGVDDRYGRIAPGYVFDAILLDSSPEDSTIFNSPGAVTGVFQAGHPIVRHRSLGSPE
jgi:imidazolonepropionase-like amidohydrolase